MLAAIDPSRMTKTEGVVRVQTCGIIKGLTILYNNIIQQTEEIGLLET